MGSTPGNDKRFEEALDRIIKQVADRNPQVDLQVDEQDLLDYLEGKAEEPQSEIIRAALASSPLLRSDFVEIGHDLDRLKQVADTAVVLDKTTMPATDRSTFLGEEAPSPWPARTPPSPENPIQGFMDFIRSLFLKPAFAYALTFALMAYPTYRFFVPGVSDSPMLSDNRLIYLDAGDITVRGEDDPGITITMESGDNPVLTLGLYAEHPFNMGQRYRIEIVNNDRTVWGEERIIKAWDPADPSRMDFQLNTQALASGWVVIRIWPFEEDGSMSQHKVEFLFNLEREF